MKGGSKAEKRRNRGGGRPRLQGVKRQPDGRPRPRERQQMTEREAKSVALEARCRHLALPEELADVAVAGGPNAGTIHGALRLRNVLTTDEQWAAAEWYIGMRASWLRAIQAPGRVSEPPDGPGRDDPDAYAEWCRSMRRGWERILDCLNRVGVEHRSPVLAAVDEILINEQDRPHLYGDLRLGLNAIHRHFLAASRSA